MTISEPAKRDANLAAIGSACQGLNHPKPRALDEPTCGHDHAMLRLRAPAWCAKRRPNRTPLSERKNTMRKFFFALTLLSVSVSTGAIAQQQRSGTPEEQKACARDVSRFCRSLMDQGDFTILACLQQNRPKLTKPCNQVLANHGQ